MATNSDLRIKDNLNVALNMAALNQPNRAATYIIKALKIMEDRRKQEYEDMYEGGKDGE